MPPKAKRTASAAQPQPTSNLPRPAPAGNQSHKNAQPVSKQPPIVNGHAPEPTGDTTESAGENTNAPAVNRKKQKRREKEAAKKAAQQLPNGHHDAQSSSAPNGQHSYPPQAKGPPKGYFTEETEYANPPRPYNHVADPNEDFFSGDDDLEDYDQQLGGNPDSSWYHSSKKPKSRKKKGSQPVSNAVSRTSTAVSRPPLPPISNAAIRSAHRMGNELWNPSTQAERENIKRFWLDLGEEERRSLVKIEKEAVLRKMKEQQKHSCSCSVCGRKRTAIEEELEVLYDAYYDELEQFANHNPDFASAPQLMAPTRPSPLPREPRQPIPGSFSPRGRVHELGEDEDDLEDDEEYDEDDDYSEDYDDDHLYRSHGLPPPPSDFLEFGNSLTVKDGILTVADDLMRNNGRHFIEMMEQLAERRMQREEDVLYPQRMTHHDSYQDHNHAPSDEEDDGYDDEEDDEYDSQEDDDFDGDEMDTMTESQRMEEGRRMFQIFAARMFEQRVLSAYREKVAAEKQNQLLQELEQEQNEVDQREAKKAREAAKKKEKKKAQKQAKDEEKAKKEAEKAAQEAAIREAEEKKLEEQRQRKEEQRKKREADRKAAEEDRIKKEAEKLKRLQEQKDRQAESDRKQREAKERERLKKEEAKKKEKEEREARESEARERKAKEAEEKKAREDQARKEKEAAAKSDPRSQGAPKAQPVALPPGLHPPARGTQIQSPSFPIATPVLPPKVPTPVRIRQPSQPTQQGQSHSSSPRSQKAATEVSSGSPASVAMPQTPAQPPVNRQQGQPPPLHHPQPNAPRSPLNNANRNHQAFNLNSIQGLGVSGAPSGPAMPPGMIPQMQPYQGMPMGGPRYPPNGMPFQPAFGGPRGFVPGQAIPFSPQIPSAPPAQPIQTSGTNLPHSRQPSGSTTDASGQPRAPIARPGPIGRPSSTTPDRQKSKKSPDHDIEQITTALGSKALLDDSDEPLPLTSDHPTIPPIGGFRGPPNLPSLGPPGASRPFGSTYPDSQQSSFTRNNLWSDMNQPRDFGQSSWPQQSFGSFNNSAQPLHRSTTSRPVAVRLLLTQACRQLANGAETWLPTQTVLSQVNRLQTPTEPLVSLNEMLGLVDTEGNGQNGGGYFELADQGGAQVIKFTSEDAAQPRNSLGDIGSPLPGHSQPFPIGQSSFGRPRGF